MASLDAHAFEYDRHQRASANVIHPRSPGGNADKEQASLVSVVPSSFMAFGGAISSNSFSMRLIIPIPPTHIAESSKLARAQTVRACFYVTV